MDKLPKLHLLASNDDLRPAMKNIHVDNGIATSTDGHVMARLDITECFMNPELLNGFQIPKEIWDQLCNAKQRTVEIFDSEKPVIVFDIEGHNVKYFIKESKETYPDFYRVLDIFLRKDLKPVCRMSFNPSLIQRIKRGCGIAFRDCLNMHFYGGLEPILVTTDMLEGLALIMPMRILDRYEEGTLDGCMEKKDEIIKGLHRFILDPDKPEEYQDILRELETEGEESK